MNKIKNFLERNKNKFIGFIIFILGVGLIVYEIIHSGIIQNWWNSLSVEVQATIIIVAILTIVLVVVGIASFLYIKFLRHLGILAGEKVNKKINNKSYSNTGDIRKWIILMLIHILNNILEYKQMIIANSLWIYSFAKFEKIDEFKGMVELAHHFELISDKEKGELTNLILNDALLVDKYFKKN